MPEKQKQILYDAYVATIYQIVKVAIKNTIILPP